jgi:hypothetical protein
LCFKDGDGGPMMLSMYVAGFRDDPTLLVLPAAWRTTSKGLERRCGVEVRLRSGNFFYLDDPFLAFLELEKNK